MRLSGCASLFCLRKYLPEVLKQNMIVAYGNDTVHQKIEGEMNAIKHQEKTDYDFCEVDLSQCIQCTSEILLQMVSELISAGSVTRQSLKADFISSQKPLAVG